MPMTTNNPQSYTSLIIVVSLFIGGLLGYSYAMVKVQKSSLQTLSEQEKGSIMNNLAQTSGSEGAVPDSVPRTQKIEILDSLRTQ